MNFTLIRAEHFGVKAIYVGAEWPDLSREKFGTRGWFIAGVRLRPKYTHSEFRFFFCKKRGLIPKTHAKLGPSITFNYGRA